MSELMVSQIKRMDKTTEEFFEIYKAVSDMYWTFDDPDPEQQMRSLLNAITNRGDTEHVVLLVKMYETMLPLFIGKTDAVSAELGFGGRSYFFKISTSPDALDKMKKIIENTVVVKATT